MLNIIQKCKNFIIEVISAIHNPYNHCYHCMEDHGIAVFGMCEGSPSDEKCTKCPYFTDRSNKNEEA